MHRVRQNRPQPDLPVIAGNGLIDRRALLGRGAVIAGAIGVVMVNTANTFPLEHMTVIDPTVTIPAAMIRLNDGTSLRNALRFRSRTNSGVFVTMTPCSVHALTSTLS